LHALVAGAEQYGAQCIDDEVQTRINLSSLVAVTLRAPNLQPWKRVREKTGGA